MRGAAVEACGRRALIRERGPLMIPKGKMIGAISLLLIVTPTIALAEIRHTAEQKAACMGDA